MCLSLYQHCFSIAKLSCIYNCYYHPLNAIQIVIDSCCATFAEVQKRGKDFWAEFELYVADLLVGVVVNVALVGMLAPYARIGQPSLSKGFLGRMQHAYGALPSRLVAHAKPMLNLQISNLIICLLSVIVI